MLPQIISHSSVVAPVACPGSAEASFGDSVIFSPRAPAGLRKSVICPAAVSKASRARFPLILTSTNIRSSARMAEQKHDKVASVRREAIRRRCGQSTLMACSWLTSKLTDLSILPFGKIGKQLAPHRRNFALHRPSSYLHLVFL